MARFLKSSGSNGMIFSGFKAFEKAAYISFSTRGDNGLDWPPCSILLFDRLAFLGFFPNIEISRVKLLVIFNSFQQTTLAVLSLHLSILNLQFLKSNMGVTVAMILGRRRVLVHDNSP
jgi:hypothetical protein